MINKLDDKTIGYIAGMIDGEGSVFLWKDTSENAQKYSRQGFFYHPVMTITNCDREMLAEIQNFIGGSIAEKKVTGNRKKCYMLKFFTNKIRELIPLFKEDIRVKKKQFELMEKYIATIYSLSIYNRWHPMPDEILQERDEIYLKLKKLNGKK